VSASAAALAVLFTHDKGFWRELLYFVLVLIAFAAFSVLLAAGLPRTPRWPGLAVAWARTDGPRRLGAITLRSSAAFAVLCAVVAGGLYLFRHAPSSARASASVLVKPPPAHPDAILSGTGSKSVNAVAFSANGAYVLTGNCTSSCNSDHASIFTGNTDMIRLSDQDVVARFSEPDGFYTEVGGIAVSPVGNVVAEITLDGSADLWNLADRKHLASFLEPGGAGGTCVAFSPDGRVLSAGGDTGNTYLWDLASKKLIATLRSGKGIDADSRGISGEAFDPGGKLLATINYNGDVFLWNLATRDLVRTLGRGQLDGGGNVVFSPNGKFLAANDGSGVYLWNVRTRKLVTYLSDPAGSGFSGLGIAISPNGEYVVSGDADGLVRVWDIVSRRLIGTLKNPGSSGSGVAAVAFNQNGHMLAAGDSNGTAYIWNMTWLKNG
jgi:WD40 repeat protein